VLLLFASITLFLGGSSPLRDAISSKVQLMGGFLTDGLTALALVLVEFALRTAVFDDVGG